MDKDKTIKGFDATKIGDVCEMTHRITSDDIKKFVEGINDVHYSRTIIQERPNTLDEAIIL